MFMIQIEEVSQIRNLHFQAHVSRIKMQEAGRNLSNPLGYEVCFVERYRRGDTTKIINNITLEKQYNPPIL